MKRKFKVNSIFKLGIIVIAVFCAINIADVTYKIVKTAALKREVNAELASLKDVEEDLNTTIKKLEDPDYLAKYAREKLLYSKNNEIIIKVK